MKIGLRGAFIVDDIAAIHDALGAAHRALNAAIYETDEFEEQSYGFMQQRKGLAKKSAASLLRLQAKLRNAMFSLERPFRVECAHCIDEVPLSSLAPNAWTKWQARQDAKTQQEIEREST